MYFRVNLKMKKPTLSCCFTWIVFIELNFTVAFLLIRKTWDDQFAGKVGGWGILRNWEGPGNGGDDFEFMYTYIIVHIWPTVSYSQSDSITNLMLITAF